MKGVKVFMVGSDEARVQKEDAGRDVAKGWIILGLFAIFVALSGGASRFDAIQIIPLRTLSALFVAFSLAFLTKEKLKSELVLSVLFGSFVLVVATQVVPLPPWLWQCLSQSDALAQLDDTLRFEGVWRPLSMAPMRTSNSLGSIVVPGAALLLAINFGSSSTTLLRIVAGLGVLNALLGLFQTATGRYSPFYLYELTNRGSPVGIFANENHAAIFAACSLLVVTFLGLKVKGKSGAMLERILYSAAFSLILFVSLVGGSRAGLVAAVGAILVSLCMLAFSPRHRQGRSAGAVEMPRWLHKVPSLILIIPIGVISLTAASFVALDRAPAFRDLIAQDGFENLRWSIWPVIAEMLKDYWFLGAGFGAFEQIYHIHEPSKLLMPSYLNQAHNDWAQLIIEGGVMAGLLVIGLFAWVAKQIVAIATHRPRRADAIFWISIFAVVGLASLIDYPLRTPLFQLVTVWLLVGLSRDARNIGVR